MPEAPIGVFARATGDTPHPHRRNPIALQLRIAAVHIAASDAMPMYDCPTRPPPTQQRFRLRFVWKGVQAADRLWLDDIADYLVT